MAGAADTLFIPIANGDITANGRWLYLGAQPPSKGFVAELKADLVCEQPMRGPFLELEARGVEVKPRIPVEQSYEGALILIGKHRAENETLIAKAALQCSAHAPILIAGDKTSGIGSLRKRIAQIAEIEGSYAKNHATVFWFFNSDGVAQFGSAKDKNAPSGFTTEPGMFSHGKIDTGSALLSEFIDESISGSVADFGAGWGYLSKVVLEKSAPRSLDLFEAHWPSLEAAKLNLQQFESARLNYHWLDVTSEQIDQRFDHIVMNPPFHTGRKTEPGLGERFIEVAASCLKPRGYLHLVANSGLPYEKKLNHCFSHMEMLEKRDGFKIIRAGK